MKIHYIYECEMCGKTSRNKEEIDLCEAQHMGLNNLEDYSKWMLLNSYAKACTAKLSHESNERLRDLEEVAYRELLAFEKEHDMRSK